MLSFFLLLTSLLLLPCTLAYEAVGHRIIFAIAWGQLDEPTRDVIVDLIPEFAEQRLENVAVWLDEVSKDAPSLRRLHFIEPRPSSDGRCVLFSMYDNCEDGRCITAALLLATVMSQPQRSHEERARALKFITHLLGDLSQPLHLAGMYEGGNLALVHFDGEATNLHMVWDRYMIEKLIRTNFQGSMNAFVNYLTAELTKKLPSGEPKHNLNEWVKCLQQPHSSSLNEYPALVSPAKRCIEEWAMESNMINCDGIWTDWDAGRDLGGDYYERFKWVVARRLLKAAYRLAVYLQTLYKNAKVRDPEMVKRIREQMRMTSRSTTLGMNARRGTTQQAPPVSTPVSRAMARSNTAAPKGSIRKEEAGILLASAPVPIPVNPSTSVRPVTSLSVSPLAFHHQQRHSEEKESPRGEASAVLASSAPNPPSTLSTTPSSRLLPQRRDSSKLIPLPNSGLRSFQTDSSLQRTTNNAAERR